MKWIQNGRERKEDRDRRYNNKNSKNRRRGMENSRNLCKRKYGKEAAEYEGVNKGERGKELDNNRWAF